MASPVSFAKQKHKYSLFDRSRIRRVIHIKLFSFVEIIKITLVLMRPFPPVIF